MIKIRTVTVFFIAMFIILSICPLVYAQMDKSLYFQGIRAAKNGELDSAFMNFKMFLDDFGESKLAENALFAVGEYYFLTSNYYDAFAAFNRFVKKYPKSKARVFALVYLLEIAKRQKNAELVENLEKEIISSRQVVLLFAESKEYKYLSAFLRSHKAIYSIDKVEFYIDDLFFAKVYY
ncbi:MAG: outer membrane protein assembly factor BamD [Candidatus Omnitrophota bacterium]|nr:outer membrane protein assembly factor BamD [Candidatus Omnitrophota bacterium]